MDSNQEILSTFREIEEELSRNGEQIRRLEMRVGDLSLALQPTEPAEHDWMEVSKVVSNTERSEWQWCRNCGVLRLTSNPDSEESSYFVAGSAKGSSTGTDDIPMCRKNRAVA